MRVTINSNVLIVMTDIRATAEVLSRGITKEATKDAPAYKVFPSADGELSKYGMGFNTVRDGKIGTTIIMPMGIEDYQAHVKAQFGDALLAAVATDTLAASQEAKDALVDSLIAGTYGAEAAPVAPQA